ncbi:polysaccharide pyruvyl transferase family protein [Leucobacter sp. NPDC058333]|uniref:polysaccharide pyruvyl transferase family protein n=1 Tax=Leucobacter sp. NPDC058333 TaxID=3346450 RepID=UPI00364BBA27
MKVIVIGDVSWKQSYHLGDEAMTEVAIAELRSRGAEVTLIAGDPELSSEFYGVDTVPQFGFRTLSRRTAWEARLDEITRALAGAVDVPAYAASTLRAVQSADAVVIAGGGNLNSEWGHHIFERLALTRAAAQAGIPLYVSSQTVGPELIDEDRDRIAEILEYARAFGAREPTTAALLREIGSDNTRIVHTLDDALLLTPADLTQEERASLAATTPYAVGSFTFHPRTTGLHPEEYYRRVAEILDSLVSRCDLDVVLLPHMGSLGDGEVDASVVGSDRYGHDRIVGYTKSGRVHSRPMLTARKLLAITAGARFTLSTRYHPVVFGPSVGVPAIGLVTSYYSAIRMRGALGNVGMEQFAIPFEAWQPVFGRRLLDALMEKRDELASSAAQAGRAARAFQSRWWDGIVADITTAGSVRLDDLPPVEEVGWSGQNERDLLALARVAHEGTNLTRLNVAAAARLERQRNTETAEDQKRAWEEVGRIAEELADTREELARVRHRLRPPGANARDRLQLSLRRFFRRGE